jgi:hypothetical protein
MLLSESVDPRLAKPTIETAAPTLEKLLRDTELPKCAMSNTDREKRDPSLIIPITERLDPSRALALRDKEDPN